ncbi:hypothetical protein ACJW30_09G089300 [Castanea mollissima]
MGKNPLLATFLLLFLIVADVSDASLLFKFRKLIGSAPNNSASVSPSPSPVPVDNKADPKSAAGSDNKKSEPPPPPPPQVDPNKGSGMKDSDTGPPSDPNVEKGHEEKKDLQDKCDVLGRTCRAEPNMTACIKDFQPGSKELVVLVQNGGENILKVNFAVESAIKELEIPKIPSVEIPKNQIKRINVPLTYDKSYKIILDAGHGECVLPVTPPGEGNSIFILPSYDKLLTPVNGAYFLILTVLVFGGTWACCKFRKKSPHGGVPYQELEMGLPEESVSAINVETAEGWDEGWDDDWDEDNAVKSPGGRHVGSISANGLTSRSSNKDGWENDWND